MASPLQALTAAKRADRVAGLAEVIRSIEAARNAVPPQRFATERGSRYVLFPDGTTLRHKAARPEHPGEFGWMDRSDATAFITPRDGQVLSVVQATGPRPMTLIRDTDTPRVAVAYASGIDAMRPMRGTVVMPQQSPAVGLLPLEMRRGMTPHFGNSITDVEPEPNWQEWLERASLLHPPPAFGAMR